LNPNTHFYQKGYFKSKRPFLSQNIHFIERAPFYAKVYIFMEWKHFEPKYPFLDQKSHSELKYPFFNERAISESNYSFLNENIHFWIKISIFIEMAIFDQKNNSFSVLGFCWESENMVRGPVVCLLTMDLSVCPLLYLHNETNKTCWRVSPRINAYRSVPYQWSDPYHDLNPNDSKSLIPRNSQILVFKGSSDPNHFIFEINVGKKRIRHRTTLK